MIAGMKEQTAQARDERIARLAAFTGVLAAQQPGEFGRVVKAAYEAGATREDLLAALEVARVLADASGALAVQAYAAIHAWHSIAVHRLSVTRNSILQAA